MTSYWRFCLYVNLVSLLLNTYHKNYGWAIVATLMVFISWECLQKELEKRK